MWHAPVRIWAFTLGAGLVGCAAPQENSTTQEDVMTAAHGEERGTVVEANVDHADGITVRDRLMPPGSRVGLSFEWEGEVVEVSGFLAGREEHIRTGAPVQIRVHPDNPRIWTYRTEPTPLWRAIDEAIDAFGESGSCAT